MQGVGYPVPAVGGAQAGSRAPSTSNCNARDVDHLASLADNATSKVTASPFTRSSKIQRTPPMSPTSTEAGKESRNPGPPIDWRMGGFIGEQKGRDIPVPQIDKRIGAESDSPSYQKSCMADKVKENIKEKKVRENYSASDRETSIGMLMGKWENIGQLEESQRKILDNLNQSLRMIEKHMLKNTPVIIKDNLASAIENIDALRYRVQDVVEEKREFSEILSSLANTDEKAKARKGSLDATRSERKKGRHLAHQKSLTEGTRKINRRK